VKHKLGRQRTCTSGDCLTRHALAIFGHDLTAFVENGRTACLWMTPSTPPPPMKVELAPLTMASTAHCRDVAPNNPDLRQVTDSLFV
jgi:hypothetical protein